jgi:arabinose-5-phosphate isomerase
MNNKKILKSAKTFTNQCAKYVSNIEFDDSFVEVVKTILLCKSKVVTTGMGKAGLAMKKFSTTLCSLGTPALYLHPAEASHGDSGILAKNDVLFVASTSGKTREVIEIIQIAQHMRVKKVIGITSHSDSPLREMCDLVIDMGVIKEPGYLGIAPTASILVMQAIADSIALAVAEEKEITFEEYSKWHHSGYLGEVAKSKSSLKTLEK